MERVLDLIFAPLARLLVARGLPFGAAEARLRRAYVLAALRAAGRDTTDSRLSLMTGLQRRDIARLRDAEGPSPTRPNPLARIVAAWLADPAYLGRPIPRRGPSPSFEALATALYRDLHPRSMADQLLAAGVAVEEGGLLRLVAQHYQPRQGSPEQLDYLAANLADHMAAAVTNVVDAPRLPERAVHYNGLSAAALDEIETLWRAEAERALLAVNAQARALQDRSPGTGRFRAGTYLWREDQT